MNSQRTVGGEELLTVDELADMSNLSVDTIRYYQTQGLLQRPGRSGRRAAYDSRHVLRLARIRTLANQGFSLAQIGNLLAAEAASQADGSSDKDSTPRLTALVSDAGGATPAGDPVVDASGHAARTYELCGRFFAALAGMGVHHVVASPGSRSTPLVISARLSGLAVSMHLDERSAGFFALGVAKRTGEPVVLVCTSGTAAANYLPAVIEASHSGIPLVVCSADRPPELRGWGAGQTIDQVKMYGDTVRWYHELPVASEANPSLAGSVAVRAVEAARGANPGPVHLNWPFRKPLEPPRGWQADPAWPQGRPLAPLPVQGVELLARLVQPATRGAVVVGPSALSDEALEAVAAFAAAAGWPVLADPASSMRHGPWTLGDAVISCADLLLSDDAFTSDLGGAEVVVHVGAAPVTKAIHQWLAAQPPSRVVVVNPTADWVDPAVGLSDVLRSDVAGLFRQARALLPAVAAPPDSWLVQWTSAAELIAPLVQGPDHEIFSELDVARALVRELPSGAALMVSNSMPIRDMDAASGVRTAPLRVLANRGASGIDGIVSTALGISAAGTEPTVLFIGDLALVHDVGGLLAAERFDLDLTIVVVDNDGGGIFSFLPVAAHGEAVHYDELFHTAHGTDLEALASAAGFDHVPIHDADALASQLGLAVQRGGRTLLHVHIPVADNTRAFARLRASVTAALAGGRT